MARNPDLLQKTYYLHKMLDKDLIDYVNGVRNASELIRNALIQQMRIDNGDIALIDIKNKQIIGDFKLNAISPTPNNEEVINESTNENKVNADVEDSVADRNDILNFLNTCNFN